jgi:hypothetical protein
VVPIVKSQWQRGHSTGPTPRLSALAVAAGHKPGEAAKQVNVRRATVYKLVGRGRGARQWTIALQPARLARLAGRVRHGSDGTLHSAGWQVRQWPPQLVEIFEVADLSTQAMVAATRMAPGWSGTATQLIETAPAVVTASSTSVSAT